MADDRGSSEIDEAVEVKVTNDDVEPGTLTYVGLCVLEELETSDRGRITAVEVVCSETNVDCTERLLTLDDDTCFVDDEVCAKNAELSAVEDSIADDVVPVD